MRDYNKSVDKYKENKEVKKPVFTAKYGLVQASAWEQESEKGTFLTFSWDRSYKDKDDQWQKAQNLRVSDIKDLQSALEDCYMFARQRKE